MPSAVLPTAGWSSGAVFPHSHTCSTPNAAAVRTIEPTLNGCVTESSSNATRAWVPRRHARLSRLTSVGRSCRGRFSPSVPVTARPLLPGALPGALPRALPGAG